MPKRYEKIRAALKKRGKSWKAAKRVAAATYNKTRRPGQKPVTRKYSRGR